MTPWRLLIHDPASPARNMAIDEALITGRGCLWTELFQPPGVSFRTVRSSWDSVDALLVDPDAPSVVSPCASIVSTRPGTP